MSQEASMSPSSRELGVMWLRDRASELRKAASRSESAYRSGDLSTVCSYVAKKYRAAAALLDEAADDLEDGTGLSLTPPKI